MRIVNVLVSIIFILLLGVGLFFLYRMFYGQQEESIIVPNIVNMDVYTARENLKIVDLKVDVVSSTFSDKPANVIIKQYPEAGMEVKKGGIIKVVISNGKREVQDSMQNFVDKRLDQILSDPITSMFLKKYNLTIKTIYYDTLLLENNRILMQFPLNQFPKNRVINLLVSKKLNPQDITNKNYNDLSDFLYNVNFDGVLVQINNTDSNEDRKVTDLQVSNDSIIVNADLNYSQIPSFKITNLYIKPSYSDSLSYIEVILSDFLGSRVILKQYYVGTFVNTLQVTYVGDGKIIIKVNGKKVSSYSLP